MGLAVTLYESVSAPEPGFIPRRKLTSTPHALPVIRLSLPGIPRTPRAFFCFLPPFACRLQVDRHIRRLDASLLAHEDSLLMGLRDGTLPSHDAPQAADKDPPGPTTSRAAIAFGDKAAYPLRERPGPKDDPSGDKKDKKLSQRDRERKRKREEKKRRAAGLPLVEMLDIPSKCPSSSDGT